MPPLRKYFVFVCVRITKSVASYQMFKLLKLTYVTENRYYTIAVKNNLLLTLFTLDQIFKVN